MSSLRIVKNGVRLDGSSGAPIACDVRYDPGRPTAPVIVVCHSFMAFKDWGFFPHVGVRLAEEGFTTVSFNFSLNGVPPGADRISDFEAFASNSFTAELDDLRTVVDWVSDRDFCDAAPRPAGLVLLGHSRGGGVAASFTSRDTRVGALVTWSAIATFDRWTTRQKEGWRKRGFLPLSADPGLNPLRLGQGVLKDLDERLPEIDPLLRAPYIGSPWLILHGRADLTVPPREAEALAGAAAPGTARLLLLDSVGHLYNGRSADEDHYLTLNHVISLTVDWLRGVLP